MSCNTPVVVALDYANQTEALNLVAKLDPTLCRLKVGKEMFTHFGPAFVTELQRRHFDVFLDLKFHDIPNTVAKAVQAAADLGVWMVNVHASGGSKMMTAAREAIQRYGINKPRLIAVTVLTSMEQSDLTEMGIMLSPAQQVQKLAALAAASGLDGVVCSAQEAVALKQQFGKNFQLVTPGIRPASSNADDQKRIMTPAAAVKAGVDFLVIGRPITQAASPLVALQAVVNEIINART
ncbi:MULTISPECIES: orotidine-5'-phosphate decarboxylase [unclassified Arsukibacterium]|uniref:orotidine-5'-phosphate decarboxylase n=1 Tax=unclassified Arsukibacterium TaxID=2635278 RepID=UPI000C50110A|nr:MULTISPECIES: orotidine-5'-phosphate decarboxylase [unclassified Arsukibacterium]MAA94399.1 orotidine-5'-phosphate decarboxylase [Rheinheimera sp.]MBM33313.1 orotidine-5'-phosphate decarboxylase [Rheinheimera sp.]HAW94133.1 orotidine-5'-phosphate decarboxylase [Candidatus Azambacteria bacterium]|tara:strand:+ start:51356 stop:52066 length:711 start_codon:yes stop_codon:yes gene_type:complete